MKCIAARWGTLLLLLHGATAHAQSDVWSGTVSLDVSYETSDAGDGGSDGEVHCTGRESVRRTYHAEATLRGEASATAEIRSSGEIETTQSCAGRQQCPGETLGAVGPEVGYSRETRTAIHSSGAGRGTAAVGVALGEDGAYTVRVEFPPVEGGTSSFDASDRTTGGCWPVEPEESHLTSSDWRIDAQSAEGSGTIDPSEPGRLHGEQQVDPWTTLRWDLRRGRPDCDGLAHALAAERERLNDARTRRDTLRHELGDAATATAGALAAEEAAGRLPSGLGASMGSVLSTAAGSLAASAASSDPAASSDGLDGWLDGPDAAAMEAQLQAAQALAPTPEAALTLSLLQQLRSAAAEARSSQSLIDSLAEAVRRCRESGGPASGRAAAP